MNKASVLDKLFEAADNHAEDSGEADHTVGDLQDLLREAWALMDLRQKVALLNGAAAQNLVEAGAREDFDVQALIWSCTYGD